MFFNLVKDLSKLNEGWSRSVSILVGSESAGIYDLGGLREKNSCRCQILRSKECRCAVSPKVFFNLVKDLCKLNEGWSRSVGILVGSESAGIYDLGGLRKKYSSRCQILRSKECRCAVSRKVFFNLVKELCKLNEGWSRSVSILVGSESAGIYDLGGLRKKYSCRCQILRSKEFRCAVSRKVFFNLVKELCKLNEGWSRSVSVLVGSESAGTYDLGGLREKYSCRCQILRSKECRCAVSRKVFFNLVKELCKLNEGWSRSVSILVGSESAGTYDRGGLREKYSCRCQILRSKECRCAVSPKVFFNLVKDLCKLNEGWSRSVGILVGSESAGIYDLGGLRKKYSSRCQILRSKECRCAVSRKVFFNLVKELCKLNEGWSRSVSILVGSESAGIYDLGGLRKKYSCRCQILRSKEFRCAVSRKVFFNLVKELCKLNEGWSRSVSILVGSESAGTYDLGGLREKYSCRCQILRSKECRCAVSRKVFFNLVKELCKLNEGWSRSVSILVGSESAGTYDLGGLREKYSCRCQILRSKECRCAVSRKFFSI